MRSYRNITDDELDRFGVLLRWDMQKALSIPPPFKALWIHALKDKMESADAFDSSLIREVTVFHISDNLLWTSFGCYSLMSGKSVFSLAGHNRLNCIGQLYLYGNH